MIGQFMQLRIRIDAIDDVNAKDQDMWYRVLREKLVCTINKYLNLKNLKTELDELDAKLKRSIPRRF